MFQWLSQTLGVKGLFLSWPLIHTSCLVMKYGNLSPEGKKLPRERVPGSPQQGRVNGCSVYSWELLVSRKQRRMHKP